jgi:hypothetical protein
MGNGREIQGEPWKTRQGVFKKFGNEVVQFMLINVYENEDLAPMDYIVNNMQKSMKIKRYSKRINKKKAGRWLPCNTLRKGSIPNNGRIRNLARPA